MAFLVGSKGIGTPTWGHSLKVDPYLWSSKLSFLYDIDYLRNIENLYGNEVLKQYILEKLKAIDKFDDCLVITDFTQFTWTGTVEDLRGGDSVSWEITTDELKCTITTGSIRDDRNAWKYINFASDMSKLFFSCVYIPSSHITACDVSRESGEYTWHDSYEHRWFYSVYTYIPPSASDFRLRRYTSTTEITLASEPVDLASGTPYKVAGYFDVSNHIQKAWREKDPIDLSNPTLSATDTAISYIKSFRLRANAFYENRTYTYRWKVPLIVAWKS
ncbi:MAG: hypothetical protein DRN61_06645 [Thaumarchaeota archaeon]|nr:MAG: hypothetical protein DRN61_06645 [Nitrososphaerota archaeon]